jgi:hypothetical protein
MLGCQKAAIQPTVLSCRSKTALAVFSPIAEETVKVLSKTTKIDTKQQKISRKSLIIRC